MKHLRDLEQCRYFLNGDMFRDEYPDYPLARTKCSRDSDGVPKDYTEIADKVAEFSAELFRNSYRDRKEKLEEYGHPLRETAPLETGYNMEIEYPEMYSMVQVAKLTARDDFQVELTAGLMRLLGDRNDSMIFLSMCKSIYVFWNHGPLRSGFEEEELREIDLLHNYLNGALWAFEEHADRV